METNINHIGLNRLTLAEAKTDLKTIRETNPEAKIFKSKQAITHINKAGNMGVETVVRFFVGTRL